MVMPFAASAYAVFPRDNIYLCKLTFCGLTFETLAGALQAGRTGLDASHRLWEQLAGPYRAGKIVFQGGGRFRTGLDKLRHPARADRSRAEEQPLDVESRAYGRTACAPSMMAHDMKSSLVLIGGIIQRLNGTKEMDPERQRRYLEIIRKEGEKLSTLLDDFLAGPERVGEPQQETRPVPLDRELHDLCEAHHLRAERQSIALTLECPPQLAPLPGDAKGLQRAFANLLDNALKYSPPGGAILVRVEEKGREVCISFADEGPGIAAGDLPRLFEAYYRGQGGGEIEGSGLGLATVKAVVAAHGGRVEVKNRPGRGAVFTVILPRPDRGE
jgi:signal transduction histidine kinase